MIRRSHEFVTRLACVLAWLACSFSLASMALAQSPPAPRVSEVKLISTPAAGQNNTYKLGDTVRARVTFDRAVDVTGSPVLKLQFDPNFGEKSMTFDATKGRTNVTALEFTWTIVAGNTSTLGIAFYANKLSGTIRSTLGGTHARLTYNKVDHNPSHKVDSVSATVTGARVSGTTLRVTFNEDLGAAASLANGAFAVKKNGSAMDLSGSPSIHGNGVTLTLASGVAAADTVTVSYAKPVTGTGNRLVDAAGNEVQSFTDRDVRTVEDWELYPAPAICGSPSQTTNWIASVTSTATTITVTFGSESLSGIDSTYIQICRPDSSDSRKHKRSQADFIFYVAGASHTIDGYDGDGDTQQSLQAGTDYWVRISPAYAWLDPPSPWHYVRTKANLTPSFGSAAPTTLEVAENSAAGTVVGTVAATDPNAGDTLSYSLVSQASGGTDHQSFAIDANGLITVASGAVLDRDTQSSYAVTVQVHDGHDAAGNPDTTVDASHDLIVTVTNVVGVSELKLVSTPAAGQNNTYKLGDTVRARVTFDTAVDVVGNPVLKLQFDPNFGEKSMTFDASKGRTNVTALEFTYEVVANNISTQGIAFFANKLSVGTNVSIRATGTQDDASLSFAKVDHNPSHKVDGVLPKLIATDPVAVTSSAGTNQIYAIGDEIDFTATFTEAVTVTTTGDPVAGPRLAFTLGTAAKHAVYQSGGGTTVLVFRYTVEQGDTDGDGISVGANALSLNGGAIADAAGNAAAAAQLEHSALAALTAHKVDGVPPTVTGGTVFGTTLKVTFSETLGTASLENGTFTVKKTSGSTETDLSLSGSPTIDSNTLTLTLTSELVATDTAVKVGYTKPTTGTGNRLVDAVGNEVQSFANVAMARIAKVNTVELVSTPETGQNDTYKIGDTVRARVAFDTLVSVVGDPVLKLQLQPKQQGNPQLGVRSMTFDDSEGRTLLAALDFVYTVAASDISTQGIAFLANQLSVGTNESIRATGTQYDASLVFAAVDHDASHKVDGVLPKLAATDPVLVTSSAGTDNTYAISAVIDITATFTEAVTVTTAGDPVAGPRLTFTLGTAAKHAVYQSGGGTTALVFRYTVMDGDADGDGISVGANALSLNGGAIADAAGNAATATLIEHSPLTALTSHKVDGVRPRVLSATAAGRTLRVTFSEPLGTAANLANIAFAVKKTPQNGSETSVGLSGSPTISGAALTLTLASDVLATDTGVKVSYVKPTTGTGNRLVDAVGNEVASFADVTVGDGRPGAPAAPTVTATDSPTSLRVSWTAPDMTGKLPITGYDIRWFKGSSNPAQNSQWTGHDHEGTGTRTTITGLEPDSVYQVQVRAENAGGEGIWSASRQGRTSSTSAPLNCGRNSIIQDWFSSVTSNTNSITITLNTPLPDYDRNHRLDLSVCAPEGTDGRYTSYSVLVIATPVAQSYTIESSTEIGQVVLQPNTDYWVRVRGGYGAFGSSWHYIRTKANLAPSFGSDAPATLEVTENSVAGTVVGTVVATDSNTEDTLTYSLTSQASGGTDHESFDIDAEGRITVAAGTTLDRETQSSYALSVQVHDGQNAKGEEDTTIDASHDLIVTLTNVVEVSSVELISTPAEGQNETYKIGDTVRARVTFDAAVDVTGNPVLKLQFDPNFGEKSMAFDTSKGRTNVTALEFTYEVVANNLSTQGIAFFANKLSVGTDASIRVAGTQEDAILSFAKVDHNPSHKVDGALPALITTARAVWVNSSPGPDGAYAIDDTIDITATFTEAVTVTTTGNPVVGPRLAFTLGTATKHAVYQSGSGTTTLVFRYTVMVGDADGNGIFVSANALALNGGVITDAAGNVAQIEHTAVLFGGHNVDGVRPSVTGAGVDGTKLRVRFSEALGSANLANGDFAVKKTPQNGSETSVGLSGSPAISGSTLTLTLASEVLASDSAVKVSYVKPTIGTGNRVIDAVGNESASFANVAVERFAKVSEVKLVSTPTLDLDDDSTAETYRVGDTVRARVTFDAAVDVRGNPVLRLQFAPNSGERSMVFDHTRGRTNVTRLEFTYVVAAGDLSTQGIAFFANKLSASNGASIRVAGTQVNTSLAFAKVEHNAAHKVYGIVPVLIATNPVSVTSSAGTDSNYVIGDTIDFTATFDTAVTVTTVGNPTAGPRLAFRLGAATKHAVYHSGGGTAALVFRYTVMEGDADSDGISVGRNALSLNGGAIVNAVGNPAQLGHSAIATLTNHKVDGVPPTVTNAAAAGTALRLAFSKPLGAASNLANGAFAVKRNGSVVNLSGSPTIRANGVTLTLASGVTAADTVTVSYVKPTAGMDNRLVDTVGNEVANFTDMTVGDGRPGAPARPTVATLTPSTLRVTWTAPDMTGKPAITGYDVRWFKGSQDSAVPSQWTGHHHTGTGTRTTVTGLEPGSTYRVQVRAKTAVGEGDWSVSGSGSTSSTSPPVTNCPSSGSTDRWFASVSSASSKTINFTFSTPLPRNNENDFASSFVDVCWPVSFGSNSYRRTRWAAHTPTARAGTSGTITGHGTQGTGQSGWKSLQAGTDYWVRFRHNDNNIPTGPWHHVSTKPNFVPAFGSNAPTAFTVLENSAAGTAVGTVAATDRNAEDTVSYSLASQASNSTDHESFTIDSNGRITVANDTVLDHETQSRYTLVVQVHDGRNAAGNPDTTVDASHDVTVTVTNASEVTAVDLISTPPEGQNDTYRPGDTVRARVTFETAVDVTGSPVLKLDLDPADGGEKSMIFDAAGGRTNVTTLGFAYVVAEGDLSPQGIGFAANKLSVGPGASIRVAGTQQDAPLSFAAIDHNPSHKVDGVLPALVATDPVAVTSSAGTDNTYVIGDAIDITTTFTEAVTVITSGDPVTGPRLAFTLGTATKHAVYHSGTDTTALVFRYTVAEGDEDADGVSVGGNALSLNSGAIADAAGNAAQLGHAALAALTDHKVDGVRPTMTGAVVDGTALGVTFSEALGTASLANGVFTVKKSSGGSETTVTLSGSPAISGNTLTLTLASALAATDTGVKVSYTKPTTGTGNRLVDVAGNEAQSFTNRAVTRIAKVSAVKLVSVPTVDSDSDNTAETYKVGDTVRARVTFDAAVDVVGNPVLKLRFAQDSGEKSMTFDDSKGRTNVTALEFTYEVVADDLSTQGIGFAANKLSAGQGVSIRSAGTQKDALLSFAAVGHNAAHKVDGVVPVLIATDPVSVTSSAGTDNTYAIGDTIDFTATFDTAVTVTTVGDPVTGPRLAFRLGAATKHAVYHSGGGTATLVFRYTVLEGDADGDGISVGRNALSLNGGAIANATGNRARPAGMQNPALAALVDHKIDGVRPSVTGAGVSGKALRVRFSEPLGTAVSLANGDFTVKKTSGGSETTVTLSGSPAIDGNTLTLTLASELAASDTDVTVSYIKPTAGTGNRLVDAVGNEAQSFANQAVTPVTGVIELVSKPKADTDGDGAVDTYKVGDKVRARVTFDSAVDVTGRPVLKLRLAPDSGEKSMTFDASKGRTNVTALEFTWTVAKGDLSTVGIGFDANKLSVGNGASIRVAGTQQNASLAFAAVDHNTAHKVDGVLPALIATNPVAVTSSAGPDKTYVRGDAIDITATFTEPVTVTTVGNPVTKPTFLFYLGGLWEFDDARFAVYRSGSGTNRVVFRYTVAAGDLDTDGIFFLGSSISLGNGEKFADAAGNEATVTQLQDYSLGPLANHKLNGSRTDSDSPPLFLSASVDGATLVLTYNEDLDEESEPVAGAFTVKVNGSAVNLVASDPVAVSGTEVTLTLAEAVSGGQTVKVSYAVPSTDPIQDPDGNDADGLSDQDVTNESATIDTSVAAPTFSPVDGARVKDAMANITLTFAEALRKDADGTALADSDLAAILTLKTDDENGTAIAFTATIDAAKEVITINPTTDLAEGDVYVAITDGYFDEAGNQGAAASATFTVDTTAPAAPTFSPADGTTVSNATGNITLTFTEAIHKDASGGDFDSTGLASILTLKTTDANGTDIAFSAVLGTDKTVITITPDSALAEGDVYVAISAEHYDEAGNKGAAASATFTVDLSVAVPTFSPADDARVKDTGTVITLSFDEAISKDSSRGDFSTSELEGILTLKTGSASGADIGFSATLDAAKTVITITPDSALVESAVYVAISNDYFDEAGNQGSAANATFTVDTTAPAAPTFSPADGTTVSNATGNITLTFTEAIHKDASGGDFDGTSLANILTLKTTDADGTDIAFSAALGTDKTVITIDPTNALADGDIYVALSAEHYDEAGNKGAQTSATITVDTTAPAAPTFSPADGDRVANATGNITLTFTEAIHKDASGGDFDSTSLANILTLKTTDADGTDIDFSAALGTDKTVITVDPAADLTEGAIHVAISNAWFDEAGNRGAAANATFTVDTSAPTVTSATVDGDTIELTWSETLDAASKPDADDFAVKVGGSATTLASITPVSITGRVVTLTLASVVSPDEEVVRVTYTEDQHPIRDAVGNKAASSVTWTVDNKTLLAAPTFTAGDAVTFTIEENAAAGTVVGTLSVENRRGALTFSRTSTGIDHESFAVDAAGRVTVAPGAELDYETQQNYSITVSVTDGRDGTGNPEPAGMETVDDTIAVTIAVTNVDLPGVPLIVPFLDGSKSKGGEALDGAIRIVWNPPTGGSAATKYRVYWWRTSDYSGTVAHKDVKALADQQNYVITGLTNGVSYGVSLTARNSEGESLFVPDNAPVSSLPYPDAQAETFTVTPTAGTGFRANRTPRRLRVSAAEAGSLLVQWDAPGNTANFVAGYEIAWTSSTSFVGAPTERVDTDSRSQTVTGLTGGQDYRLRVSTIYRMNAGAEGEFTAPAFVSATALSSPSAVTDLRVEAGNGEVRLRWAPPASDGGLPLARYEVRWGASGETPAGVVNVGLARQYAVTGLTNGQEYEVQVRAVNRGTDPNPGGGGTARSFEGRFASVSATPNMPPTSTDVVRTTQTDTDLTLGTADFPFTDAGDTLAAVRVVALPAAAHGVLYFGNPRRTVSAFDRIVTGNLDALVFAPAAGFVGTVSFRFRVEDSRGALSGTNTFYVKVQNAPPATAKRVLLGVSLVSDPGADETYAVSDKIRVRATFNEFVQLQAGSSDNIRAKLVFVNGTSRVEKHATYDRGDGTSSLELTYTVAAGDVAPDGVGIVANSLTGVEDTSTSLGVELSHVAAAEATGHKVDGVVPRVTVAPALVSTPSASGIYGRGEHIDVVLTFSEPMAVNGAPSLGVLVGSETRTAIYRTGSGTVTLTFRYTVVAADADADGVSVPAGAVTLGTGGALTDGAGNEATLTYTTLAAQAAHKVKANAAPTVANAILDQATETGTAFNFRFAENTFADTDGDTLSYAATKGDGSALPGWLSFTADTRTFSGTPQTTDAGTVTVKVTADDGNGGTVSDRFDIAVSVADTTAPTVTFSPTDGARVKDTGTVITLSFDEVISKDSSRGDFDTSELEGILMLKTDDENGTDIDFSAVLDAAGKVITITPDNALVEGDVYVSISNGYFDARGNQGAAASATFTVDTTAPAAPTFSPADGTTVSNATGNITLTFTEAIHKDVSGGAFDGTSLANILTLKTTDAGGTDIAFSATLGTDNTVITIDPTNALVEGDVYVAISAEHYDEAGNKGTQASATFTIDTTAPGIPTFSPVDDARVKDTGIVITLSFDEAISKDSSRGDFSTSELEGVLTLKTDDENGTDIDFSAVLDAAGKVITITPDNALVEGDVYVSISNGYFDAHGNQGAAAAPPSPLTPPPRWRRPSARPTAPR